MLAGAVFLQIGLAFAGISLQYHRILGGLIGLVALLLAGLAVSARLPRATTVLSCALPLLVALQLGFIALRGMLPALAAAHGINAILILGLALIVAVEAEEQMATPVS